MCETKPKIYYELMNKFFDKYFSGEALSCEYTDRLTVRLTLEALKKYDSQLTKQSKRQPFAVFKRYSPMGRLWEKEVIEIWHKKSKISECGEKGKSDAGL